MFCVLQKIQNPNCQFIYGDMLNVDHLNNILVGGDPILSKTINLRTYESEIAQQLTNVQNNNKEVEIGSYPFFRQGKLGVSIVLRSIDQNKIDKSNSEILKFVKEKNIEIVELD